MHNARIERGPRRGFTLVELLVVMAIIAVLAGLLLSGVQMMRLAPFRAQAGSEIGQLTVAISDFHGKFNVDYIPSYFVLREDAYNLNNPIHARSAAYLQRLFGTRIVGSNGQLANGWVDWNGNGSPTSGDIVLTGEQCLVFFLGGIPDSAQPQCLGFSTVPHNPAAPGGTRIPPFFKFKSERLDRQANGFFAYRDPFMSLSGTARHYVYFAANKNSSYDAPSAALSFQGACYYRDGNGTPLNPQGYQILTAGIDATFGSTAGAVGSFTPSGPNTLAGRDDMANFANGALARGN